MGLQENGTFQVRATSNGNYNDSDRYMVLQEIPTLTTEAIANSTYISGTAVGQSVVDIWENGVKLASTKADQSGHWSAPLIRDFQQIKMYKFVLLCVDNILIA